MHAEPLQVGFEIEGTEAGSAGSPEDAAELAAFWRTPDARFHAIRRLARG